MCNSKNPQKSTWFNGTNPLVYTLGDKLASNLRVLGECADGMTLYSFTMKTKNYVGKGQLTSSGKNFRYLTTVVTDTQVSTFDEANKLF